jgi:uncharacterized membrane protein YbhN (UPF0104 family)
LTAMSTLANYTLPFQAGIGVKAIYLKKCRNLHYVEFLSLSTLCIFLSTAFYTAGAALALAAGYIFKEKAELPLLLLFGGYTLAIMLLYFVPTSSIRFFKSINVLGRMIYGWEIFKNNKDLLLKWMLSIVVRVLLDIAIFYFITLSVGIHLDLFKVIVLALAKECSLLIKITPASLGITEGLLMYLCVLYGINATNGLVMGFLSRIVELVPTSLFSVVLYSSLRKNLQPAEGR